MVRLYEGPRGESTIVGFSASAIPYGEDGKRELHDFFTERGYDSYPYQTMTHYTEADMKRPEWNEAHQNAVIAAGTVSLWHCGVEPPLSDQHVREFGDWCAENVDTSHNYGYLVDNRQIPPRILGSPTIQDGVYLREW